MDAALEGFAEMGSLSCAHLTLQQESQATLVLKLPASLLPGFKHFLLQQLYGPGALHNLTPLQAEVALIV